MLEFEKAGKVNISLDVQGSAPRVRRAGHSTVTWT